LAFLAQTRTLPGYNHSTTLNMALRYVVFVATTASVVLLVALRPLKTLILCAVDPLDFDKKCDGAVPLEEMLSPDSRVHKLLEDIDRSKCRVWALTNAFWTVREVLHRRGKFRRSDEIFGSMQNAS